MNIQIFGTTKCFDTKKAQRWFKERGIKFQMIDLAQKGMSKGELDSVLKAVGGLDNLLDQKSKSYASLVYLAYDEDKNFDLLLLDVEMGGMDGVTMARRVRAENTAVQIVFITGYTDYIAEGYDVAALHYLVKPVREEKLFEVLDRAAAKLRSDSRALTLECGGEIFRVPLYEIRYLDVEKNYTTVHAKRDYTVKKTLGALSDELDERFFRIGRAAIVNLSYIRRVTKTDAILSDGAAIPLPRGAYEALNRAIIAYH